MALKITSYGKRYFTDSWNIFDMVIVILSIIGLIMTEYSTSKVGSQTTIIRSFRIIKIFYIFKKNKALKSSLMTLMVSFPAMANIGSLLLLLNLIYSVLGVYLFAEVKPTPGLIDSVTNFQSVGRAFITLIRIMTGEGWPKLMEALSREYSTNFQCVENPTFEDYRGNNYQPVGCGSRTSAKFFFFSYSLLICTIFMKLFIAIILQTFQQTTERENKFMSTDISEHFK
jgi:hypothetical protein